MFKNISEFHLALNSGHLNSVSIIHDCLSRGLEFKRHPLGFLVCNIFTAHSKKARLHIWLPSSNHAQDKKYMIHDHIFRFTSWVIQGTIENIEYQTQQNQNTHAIYNASYDKNSSTISKTKTLVGLTETKRTTYTAGQSYNLEPGQLHETHLLGSDPAVTILITEDIEQKNPIVLGDLDGELKHTFHRNSLSPRELIKILQSYGMKIPPMQDSR